MNVMHSRYRTLHDERGFTLIEILIALLIGLFLLGALLTIVQANRTVFGNQNKLAQLQDGERMAMTVMADVIQSAGYFPDPTTNTLDRDADRRRTIRRWESRSTAFTPRPRPAIRSPFAT